MARKKKEKKKRSRSRTRPKNAESTEATDAPAPDGSARDEAIDETEAAAAPPDDEADLDGEPRIEDLDAVLDDVDADEDLDDLIAATVAAAGPEDEPVDPQIESLDEDPPEDEAPVVIVDDEDEGEAEDPAALVAAVANLVDGDLRGDETPAGADAESDDAAQEELAATEAATRTPPPSPPEDLEDAFDLGSASTPELRDRLLAQTLAHAERQDARYRVPFSDPRPVSRVKAAVAAILFLVAFTAAVAPPAWVRPEPPARLDAERRATDLHRALLLQAQQVDAFWVRAQRLPTSLDEIPERLPGIRYVRSGNRLYQLIAYEPDGDAIVYDSTDPAPAFSRVRPGWIGGQGP